ncbi:MAG: hypothetical protein V8R51_06640 [Clostridia bacterium]
MKSELVANTDHTSSEKREESGLFGNKITENKTTESNVEMNGTETISEQIYKARQNQKNAQTFEPNNNQDANKNVSQESGKIEIPEIEKSQEVLRKLQEMKQKVNTRNT